MTRYVIDEKRLESFRGGSVFLRRVVIRGIGAAIVVGIGSEKVFYGVLCDGRNERKGGENREYEFFHVIIVFRGFVLL